MNAFDVDRLKQRRNAVHTAFAFVLEGTAHQCGSLMDIRNIIDRLDIDESIKDGMFEEIAFYCKRGTYTEITHYDSDSFTIALPISSSAMSYVLSPALSQEDTALLGIEAKPTRTDDSKSIALPPSCAEKILLLVAPKTVRDYLPGDLEEEFYASIAPRHGYRFARRWYWTQVVLSVPAMIRFHLLNWMGLGVASRLAEWLDRKLGQ